ncbi:hypothetical protein N9C89_00995 [Halocynthiibacter sp. SDUM655004]|uniref:Uncharacterized protein n=1 Tax=Halocynthiibacter halioticoli TaxID=2986804 RepID=A0AAE3IVV3_9RHOB|nr:hypothetical protein [Halocynthiibacter halioticoli]MCW4056118.1 hypothetical protein [Halocynthiibacter sp. SDUM655004]
MIVFFLSAIFGISEYKFLVHAQSSEQTAPPSLSSRRQLLERCIQLLADPTLNIRPSFEVSNSAERCLATALKIEKLSAESSRSQLVIAQSSLLVGKEAAAIGAISNSQKLAPSEGWLAAHRVRLLVPLIPSLTPEAQSAFTQDASVLLASAEYSWVLPQIYVGQKSLRPYLQSIVEELPEFQKQVFLNQLARRAEQTNG